MPVDLDAFLASLNAAYDEHEACDQVYNMLDDLLINGDVATCSKILSEADPSRLHRSTVRAMLIITRRSAPELFSRVGFMDRADEAYPGISQKYR